MFVFVGVFNDFDRVVLLVPSHGEKVMVDKPTDLLQALEHAIKKCFSFFSQGEATVKILVSLHLLFKHF